MHPFDIASAILMLVAAIVGFRDGLLRQIASWVGFVVGLYVAYHYAATLGQHAGLATWVGFAVLCIGVPLCFGWCASLVTKVLDWTILAGAANRIGGALLSVAKWALLLSFATYFGSMLVAVPESLRTDSFAYGFLHTFSIAFWQAL